MAKSDEPITIKKYANRRLYNTGTSTYVTLEDLATMVKSGEDFLVYDAKTGDDITRSGARANHLRTGKQGGTKPAADDVPAPADPLLRRQHADAGAALSRTVDRHADARAGEIPHADDQAFGGIGAFGPLEEQVRRNMELFQQTFSMFKPFTAPRRTDAPAAADKPADDSAKTADEMETLRRQMKEMQDKLDQDGEGAGQELTASSRHCERQAAKQSSYAAARSRRSSDASRYWISA